MMPPVGFLGEKKKVGLMSPSPNSRSLVTVRGRLRDHRHDPAGDHVPILVERDQDHGLDVQDILRLAVRADGKVQIVLEGQADDVGDRTLRRPGEVAGASTLLLLRKDSAALRDR
jgi:hypothetical protein